MKRRIMSRGRIFEIINGEFEDRKLSREGKFAREIDQHEQDLIDRQQAQVDLMAYLLADGDTVKVYNDRDHGGWVVETKP